MPLESDTPDYKRLVMLPEAAYAPCDDSRTIPVRSIKLVWEVPTAHAQNNTRVARVANRIRPNKQQGPSDRTSPVRVGASGTGCPQPASVPNGATREGPVFHTMYET